MRELLSKELVQEPAQADVLRLAVLVFSPPAPFQGSCRNQADPKISNTASLFV